MQSQMKMLGMRGVIEAYLEPMEYCSAKGNFYE
jgi:hypothetical protein